MMKRLLTISPLLALALSLGGCGDETVTKDTPRKAVECVWKSPDAMPDEVRKAITDDKQSWNFSIIGEAQARGGFSGGGYRGGGFSRPSSPSYRPSYSPRSTYDPRPTTTTPSNRVPAYTPSYRRTTDPRIITSRYQSYTPSAAPVAVNNGSWLWPTMAVLLFMHTSNNTAGASTSTALADQASCLAYKFEGKIKLTPNGETLTK